MQPDESGKLPTITEDDTAAKTKTNKPKQTKKEKAAEKSRAKESRGSANLNNSSLSNGDTSIDAVQVAVARGQQRTSVDMIELTQYTKSKETDSSSSPFPSKHTSQATKSSTSMKTSSSNKDIKNAKLSTSDSRNLITGSNGTESFSTDL